MSTQKVQFKTEIANKMSGRSVIALMSYITNNLLLNNQKGYAYVHEFDVVDGANDLMTKEWYLVNVFEPNKAAPTVYKVEIHRALDWSCINTTSKKYNHDREYLLSGIEFGECFTDAVTQSRLNAADGDNGASPELYYSMIDHQEQLDNLKVGDTLAIPTSRDNEAGMVIVCRKK